MNQKTKQLSIKARKLFFYKISDILDGIRAKIHPIMRAGCEYMKI